MAVLPLPIATVATVKNGESGLSSKLKTMRTDEIDVPHIQVPALAGTGKTTSMIQGLIAVKGGKPSIVPSEQQQAIWDALKMGRSDTVRFSAFNSDITAEAVAKLTEAGLDKLGVEGKGIHALGRASVLKAFPELRRFNLDKANWVSKDIIAETLGGNWHDLRRTPKMPQTMAAVETLVSLCKQTLTEPTQEGLDLLTSHYDVELEGADTNRVYSLVPEVLGKMLEPKGRYNFDDMIWLTVKHELPVEKVDVQIVDEKQDMNRMQQELIYKAGWRIVGVGDRHQAIYGFAGADAESMDRMAAHLKSTPRGLLSLPLTVTRRCGKAIVKEAQRYVPEYMAHESNPEGRVGRERYPIQGSARDGNRRELPWEESYCHHVKPGSMVLCRVNAPLVGQCFRFLARGIPANIQGKKIGEGLMAMVKSSKAIRVPDLISWVGDWLVREVEAEEAKRNPSESKLDALQDKHDCVLAFCEGLSEVADVSRRIGQVFTESRDNPGVKFSSCHKAKGLEAKSVFILQPPGVGMRLDKMQRWELDQEDNLKYVAITRAIEELIYVS